MIMISEVATVYKTDIFSYKNSSKDCDSIIWIGELFQSQIDFGEKA